MTKQDIFEWCRLFYVSLDMFAQDEARKGREHKAIDRLKKDVVQFWLAEKKFEPQPKKIDPDTLFNYETISFPEELDDDGST